LQLNPPDGRDSPIDVDMLAGDRIAT